MLLADALNEFLFDCRLRKLSERTLKGYKNNNLKFLEFLRKECGIVDLERFNYKMAQLYITELSELGRKETYINGLIKSFHAFFKYCAEEEYISLNPIGKIKFQKEPIVLINTFTDDEVVKMIKFYSGGKKFLEVRNNLILTILFDSGIRNLELCSLKVEDVRETYIKIIGKGNKERHVPITPSINKALIRYNRVRETYIKDKMRYETEYLLLSQKGRKLTVEALEHILKIVGKECNVREHIRVSPHTCRHYFAQAQLRNGCDLFTVSKLLGHSNINITKRYLNSMHDDDILKIAIKTSPLGRL